LAWVVDGVDGVVVMDGAWHTHEAHGRGQSQRRFFLSMPAPPQKARRPLPGGVGPSASLPTPSPRFVRGRAFATVQRHVSIVVDLVSTVLHSSTGMVRLVGSVALVVGCLMAACSPAPSLSLWVDGFAPEHVTFEVKDVGRKDDGELEAWRRERAADGVMRVPAGSCPEGCRVAEVTVFVTNRTAHPEAPPVVRLRSPPGRERRLPIAFGGVQIDPGRTGRVRWLVQLWPEEQALEATVSSSVGVEITAAPTVAKTAAPTGTAPTP
jgi:hypothetical protein